MKQYLQINVTPKDTSKIILQIKLTEDDFKLAINHHNYFFFKMLAIKKTQKREVLGLLCIFKLPLRRT